MTAYRRLRVPGATYAFTLCLEAPGARTLVDHIDLLRAAWARTVAELPVTVNAIVILPDHLHAVLTEPEGEVHFPERWRRIKARFSHSVGGDFAPNASKVARRERGLWQRRYWEHMIRDDHEYQASLDWCAGDPVRHGLVARAADWPFSMATRRLVTRTPTAT